VATQFAHRPVLLETSLSFLALRPNATIVDGTLGAGGHAAAILERIAPDGVLIGLDRDPAAIAAASRTLAPFADRARLRHASFRDLHQVLAEEDVLPVDGVLFDLGVSSPQLDDPQRGTYLRWMFFGAGCIEPAIVDKLFVRPAVERKSAASYGSYEDTLNTVETALKPGPFILGQRFSAADVYVGAQIQWGLMVKALEPRPVFSQYMERIAARPALQRVLKGA